MSDAISRFLAENVLLGLNPLADKHECIKALRGLPALDVEPVVHAHWIKTFGSDGFVSTLRCSKCNSAENSTYIPGNFCWFCGAKMDGEAE